MKKLCALTLALMITMSLASCGSADTPPAGEAQPKAARRQESPRDGTMRDWPQNEYTAFLPKPDMAGQALCSLIEEQEYCSVALFPEEDANDVQIQAYIQAVSNIDGWSRVSASGKNRFEAIYQDTYTVELTADHRNHVLNVKVYRIHK